MAEDDNWRRRRADELFGKPLGATLPLGPPPQSLYRGTREQSAPRAIPPTIAIGFERDARVGGPADFPGTPVAARSGGVSTRAALRGLAALVALFFAAAIGWLVRGDPAPPSAAVDSIGATVPTGSVPIPIVPRPTRAAPVTPAAVAPTTPEVAPAVVPLVEPKVAPRSERVASRPPRVPPAITAKKTETPVVAAKQRITRADRPSFDCRRNRGAVAQLICTDPVLATLDRRLAARFTNLDASADKATVLRIHEGETRFLNARQTCTTTACVERSYRHRLDELDSGG